MRQVRLSEEERKRRIIEAAAEVARDKGLDKMSARAVAQAAGISHGLILHHFGSMDELQSTLLDWVLARVLEPQTTGLELTAPEHRLLKFLERQLEWLDAEPQLMEIVFDYWSRGTRDPAIQSRISNRMQSFREAIEPVAADLIATDPKRFRDTSPNALAVTTGDLVLGYAIQRQIHPLAADRESVLTAVKSLIGS